MAFKVKLVKEIEFDIGGTLIKIREPSFDEMISHTEASEKAIDTAAKLMVMREFIYSLGFPKDLDSKLKVSTEGFSDLIQVLTGQKKS